MSDLIARLVCMGWTQIGVYDSTRWYFGKGKWRCDVTEKGPYFFRCSYNVGWWF